MSRKVNKFASIITNPLNIHNFVVDIPGFEYSILVSSTSFPSEKLRTVTKYYQGEKIDYPTIPELGGSWEFTIPENDNGIIKKKLDSFKSKMWDQKSGIFVPNLWKNVTVTSRQLDDTEVFSVILHGAYLLGRNSVNLKNSDPTASWDWDYQFRYQWIEDVDFDPKASINPLSD